MASKYKPLFPITAMNCPTREALERKPGDPGFRTLSIQARHTEKSRQQRLANLAARAEASRQLRKR